mmetsp:Transcript_14897/g.56081  ORF Transcript_14897/g.56081 Transcript_14897/m.56081 type:complete len:217 (+) Transcript_14897:241-891(+)
MGRRRGVPQPGISRPGAGPAVHQRHSQERLSPAVYAQVHPVTGPLRATPPSAEPMRGEQRPAPRALSPPTAGGWLCARLTRHFASIAAPERPPHPRTHASEQTSKRAEAAPTAVRSRRRGRSLRPDQRRRRAGTERRLRQSHEERRRAGRGALRLEPCRRPQCAVWQPQGEGRGNHVGDIRQCDQASAACGGVGRARRHHDPAARRLDPREGSCDP